MLADSSRILKSIQKKNIMGFPCNVILNILQPRGKIVDFNQKMWPVELKLSIQIYSSTDMENNDF